MTSTKRTARVTGLAYLGLAVTGTANYLLFQQLFTPGDAAGTAANLVAHEGLARLGVVAGIGAVLTQAAAAVGFWQLFRRVHPVGAGSIAAFGLVNCVTLLVAAMCSATALDAALRGDLASTGDAALLQALAAAAFGFGGVFYGLWLLPMGWLVGRSGYMPPALGRVLLAGGAGYVLSVLVDALVPGETALVYLLTVPATIGEVWMVGHLLVKGVSSRPPTAARPALGAVAASVRAPA